jgi:hypothetical protein
LDDSPDKLELNPPHTSVTPRKFDVYEIYEQEEVMRIASMGAGGVTEDGLGKTQTQQAGKRGMKRGREVSKYQRYADMDEELQGDGHLWRYLTALAAYPGDSDEFISNHRYRPDRE